MMTQAIISVVAFVLLLAMAPWAVRALKQRAGGLGAVAVAGAAPRVVSALAVGPQQRVVTVEVGPESARTWLVLGVTTQTITNLHSTPAPGFARAAAAAAALQPGIVPAVNLEGAKGSIKRTDFGGESDARG
jgi:flagellar protein FliO/FliZ